MVKRMTVREPKILLGFLLVASGAIIFFLADGVLRLSGIVFISAGSMIFDTTRRNNLNSIDAAGLIIRKYRTFMKTWPVGVAVIISLCLSFYLLDLDSKTPNGNMLIVLYFTLSGISAMAYWVYLSGWTKN